MALQVGDLNERGERIVELFAGFIPISTEGKARARKRLDEARARMTPEMFAALRAQLGMSPTPRRRIRGYPDGMAHDTEHQDAGTPTEVGTPEGRAWARKVLAEARARMTEQDWSELQERFGRRERRAA